jgi:DNA polymerase III subunit epsilon
MRIIDRLRRGRTRIGASGAALDLPWREADYCVVDLETTGLDLRHDEICSFGAVCISNGRIQAGSARYEVFRPDCALSVPSICIHNLLQSDLTDAPTVGSVVPDMRGLLDGRVLVAHAAWIEQAFLNRALRSSGARLADRVVDTAGLARASGLGPEVPGHEPSLEGLAVRLGIDPHDPHHALGDALTTAEVFLVLASRLEREGCRTVRDLVRLSAPTPTW